LENDIVEKEIEELSMATIKGPSKGAESVEKLADKTLAAADKAAADMKQNMKTGFDKVMSGVDELTALSRENLDAMMESAVIASKAVQELNSEMIELSRTQMDSSIAATKAVLSTRDISEAFDIQQEYARNAFDNYIKEFSRLSDKWLEASKDICEPLTKRVEAVSEKVQSGIRL
jgi:phasin family protein